MRAKISKSNHPSPASGRLLPGLALLLVASGLVALVAADLRIQSFVVGEDRRPQLNFTADALQYYRLLHGDSVTSINRPVAITLTSPLIGPAIAGDAPVFFRLQSVPRLQSLDSDGDGIPDSYELDHPPLNPLNVADAATDPDGNGKTFLQEFQESQVSRPPMTTVVNSSPLPGEDRVAVTRETIFYFSQPLNSDAVVTTQLFYAEFGGRKVLSRAELSSDRRKATLFYLEDLPASARVLVRFVGDGIKDASGVVIDPDGNGIEGGRRCCRSTPWGSRRWAARR